MIDCQSATSRGKGRAWVEDRIWDRNQSHDSNWTEKIGKKKVDRVGEIKEYEASIVKSRKK